jgi:hypothetical protein
MSHAATVTEEPSLVRTLDVVAKAALVLLLISALMLPDLGNMRDKAAGLRAIGYPLLAFLIPLGWWMFWKDRSPFPWLADLMVTVTCFTDLLGNRLDLYDSVVWFDDWMHLMNTGLLAAAAVLLTLPATSRRGEVVERALAVGVTGAVAWELGEYFAFVTRSSERTHAYADTLGDLALGTGGAVLAAFVVHAGWRHGRLAAAAAPVLLPPAPDVELPEPA